MTFKKRLRTQETRPLRSTHFTVLERRIYSTYLPLIKSHQPLEVSPKNFENMIVNTFYKTLKMFNFWPERSK